VFVRRRTVFVRTVFFKDLLILIVRGFNDLHSALRKSTNVIARVTSYLVGRGARYSVHKNPTPLSALQASYQYPYFLYGSTPMPPREIVLFRTILHKPTNVYNVSY